MIMGCSLSITLGVFAEETSRRSYLCGRMQSGRFWRDVRGLVPRVYVLELVELQRSDSGPSRA